MDYSLSTLNHKALYELKSVFISYWDDKYKLEQARILLEDGLMLFKQFKPLFMTCWIDETRERSLNRLIHGHVFIHFMISAYQVSGNSEYIVKCEKLIKSYFNEISYMEHQDTFAFHDETTSLRVDNWLKLLIYAYECLNQDFIDLLLFHLGKNLRLLNDDKFFAGYNNHGMLQNFSLMTGSYIFTHDEAKASMQKAMNRLNTYFSNAFTSEGIHVENSPMYHAIVLSRLTMYLHFMSIVKNCIKEELVEIQKKATQYIFCTIRENGCLLTLGDTIPNSLPLKTIDWVDDINYPLLTDPNFLNLHELRKKEEFFIYPSTGYAYFYDKHINMYACFAASFEAEYHKHNDDLQFIIDLDEPLMIDPASPGYQYNDPHVIYGRSYRAHNTLTVDGTDLPRKKNGKPVYITDYMKSEEKVFVNGINKRHPGVEHKRCVNYSWKTHIFEIEDIVLSNENHEYTLCWHFAPNIELLSEGNSINIIREKISVACLEILSEDPFTLSTVNGQIEPYIQGFCFDEFYSPTPCAAIEIVFCNKANLEVKWILKIF